MATALGADPGVRRSVPVRLVTGTIAVCFRYRVTGLAAEAGFFALLSLPPLLLGLVGSIGYLGDWVGSDLVRDARARIIDAATTLLSDRSVQEVLVPTLDDVIDGGRFELISVGFLLALWSGSRALNVYVDTITIMYGLAGRRGIIGTRALSFSLYLAGLIIGSVTVPLLLAGPDIAGRALPEGAGILLQLYLPLVILLSVGFLTLVYHLAVPVRGSWRRDIPGAVLALLVWVVGSILLRWVISVSVGGTSIYGPLAAPIVVLLWLYLLSIALLGGAALNATVHEMWPDGVVRAEIPADPVEAVHAAEARENQLTPVAPARSLVVKLPVTTPEEVGTVNVSPVQPAASPPTPAVPPA